MRLEFLEPRQLLSASRFKPDYVFIPLGGSSTSSGITPAQMRAAYGFSGVAFGSTKADGNGQTIAIVDAYDDPKITSDLAAFDQAYGIAAPPSFNIVNESGGTNLPGTDPQQGWEGETALDVEWAHAIAPGANILLVETNSASDADLFAGVNYARNAAGVSVVSMSFGSNDDATFAAYDSALSTAYLVTPVGHQGVTFLASSGDHGFASFPSTSPNVLSVGGTDLYVNSSGTILSETAWEPQSIGGLVWSGGGGVSAEFTGRKTPDVAYNAGVPVAVYDTFGPSTGWGGAEGTSCGSPQWAALVAIADQGRALSGLGTLNGATQTLKAIYAAPPADFHDITVGSTQFQPAGPGYDLATGNGSPVANLLIPYLATYGSTGGGGGGTTTTAPAAPANFLAQVVSTTQVNLSWSPSTGATSYKVFEWESGQAVVIATLSSSTTSLAVSNLTAGSTYSFQVAAYNAVGFGATGWVQVTLALTTTVTAPTGVRATALSSTVAQVSWSLVTGATGYIVYEWNGVQSVQVASVGANATAANISGQAPGATEYFQVAAYDATSSATSAFVSVVMPVPAAPTLTAPANVSAKATSSTTATVSWSTSANATGYAIYFSTGGGAVLLGTVSGSTTSISISGMSPGATYYFSVVAYNSASSAASAFVPLTMPLSNFAALDSVFGQSTNKNHLWRIG
ncbi:MAG TPA: fibronectin type III domain-containing protein [Pirellulales bacterium]|nr:fibronectin type III domain-containing protein [Pirellulales bacterium]